MRSRAFLSVAFLIVPALLSGRGGSATHDDPTGYRPPVVAPVTDPFRAPNGPYGSGNRGLDYATAPGSAVAAIGAGVVVFTGTIAHRLYVTVLHPDGLRSSYSFLATIEVTLGQAVVPGQRVGTAGAQLQLGVRRGATYIDPASLFGRRGRPHLVRPAR